LEELTMIDLLGYAASCAVLATFVMRTMVPLRSIAILSNILFIAFAYYQHIYPVFLLHVVLLPVNGWRLIAAIAAPVERSSFGRPASIAPTASSPRPLGFWFAVGIVGGVVSSSAVLAVAANPLRGPHRFSERERPPSFYAKTLAPACAICSSSCDCTPDTPMAPTHSF